MSKEYVKKYNNFREDLTKLLSHGEFLSASEKKFLTYLPYKQRGKYYKKSVILRLKWWIVSKCFDDDEKYLIKMAIDSRIPQLENREDRNDLTLLSTIFSSNLWR